MPGSTKNPSKASYGWDAPGIMLGLGLGGGAAIAIGIAVATQPSAWLRRVGLVLALVGAVPTFFGVLMLVYGLIGKPRTRDHILGRIAWRGDERVLDIGTGAGLLLIGAAKRLTTGRAVGVDVWASKDLSDNAAATTLRNVTIEQVADRIDIVTGDIRAMDARSARYDCVLSLLCLHNIEPPADRDLACREIARVLKPGGRVVIGDYVPTHRYAAILRQEGLIVRQSRSAFATALSLMWILVADKPARLPAA